MHERAQMSQPHPVSRIVAAASALCSGACAAFAQTTAEIEKAVQDAVAKLGLQTEIPGDPQPPGWLDINLPAIRFSDWILWGALAIAVGIALYIARDSLPRLMFGKSKRWRDLEDAGTDAAVGASPAEAASNADELASRGLYREAMHLLLLRAIAELRHRLGMDFARSLTSREILRRANLPEEGKAPLRDIITRVELSYFGAYPAAANDYAACRTSFDRLMDLLLTQGSRA
jgi:hypothetical protein